MFGTEITPTGKKKNALDVKNTTMNNEQLAKNQEDLREIIADLLTAGPENPIEVIEISPTQFKELCLYMGVKKNRQEQFFQGIELKIDPLTKKTKITRKQK